MSFWSKIGMRVWGKARMKEKMYVIYKGEKLRYVEDFYGDTVLWITNAKQIDMEHMTFVGGYPNEYCIFLKELSEEEQAEIRKQIE